MIVIILALLAIALLTVLVSQRLAYREQLAGTRRQLAALQQLRPTPPNRGGLNRDPAELLRLLQANQPAPSGVAIDPGIRAHDPDAAAAHRRILARSVQRLLGPLVDGLNLPAGTASKLRNLLVERRLATDDARAAVRQEGIHDRGLAEQAEAVATKDVDDQIAALLGPDANHDLQRRLAVADEYNQLQSYVALDMSYAGVPLSQDQALALAEAAKSLHYSTLPSASGARLTDAANPGVNVHEAILAKAAAILTPNQLAVFRADQEEKLHEEALRLAEVKSMQRVSRQPVN